MVKCQGFTTKEVLGEILFDPDSEEDEGVLNNELDSDSDKFLDDFLNYMSTSEKNNDVL